MRQIFIGVLAVVLFCTAVPSRLLAAEWAGKVLACGTHPATTSLGLSILQEGGYEVYYVHHFGAEFAPIHLGVLTGYDIEQLQILKDHALAMGQIVSVQFTTEECNVGNRNQLSCRSDRVLQIGDLTVQGVRWNSYAETKIDHKGEAYKYQRFALSYGQKKGFVTNFYNMPMEFSDSECEFFNDKVTAP